MDQYDFSNISFPALFLRGKARKNSNCPKNCSDSYLSHVSFFYIDHFSINFEKNFLLQTFFKLFPNDSKTALKRYTQQKQIAYCIRQTYTSKRLHRSCFVCFWAQKYTWKWDNELSSVSYRNSQKKNLS